MLDGAPDGVHEPGLVAWIEREDHSAQWLSGHLASLLVRRGGTFEARSVPPLVGQLIGRGLLVPGSRGLEAGPALSPLVRRMMLLDRVLELRAGRAAEGGSPVIADLVVVRADSGAFLLWEADDQGALRWVTPTADEAKAIATRLLTHPDALARAR